MSKMNWSKATKKQTQAANPRGNEPVPLRGGSHVKPGPVKTWADMTPEQRKRVMASIRPPGVR